MHIEWLFVDVCIILNAKLDRDMSSNSVFNIQTWINSYSVISMFTLAQNVTVNIINI